MNTKIKSIYPYMTNSIKKGKSMAKPFKLFYHHTDLFCYYCFRIEKIMFSQRKRGQFRLLIFIRIADFYFCDDKKNIYNSVGSFEKNQNKNMSR
jgi:hypothetical protein